MNITYTWNIQSIDVVTSLSDDGYNNIVKKIYWSLNAMNVQFVSDFIADVSTVDIFSDKSNFINYSDLTQEQVISWIHEILGEEKINDMKKLLEDRIQSAIDYPTNIFALPWINYAPQETVSLEVLPETITENIEQLPNEDLNDDPYGILAQAEFELENGI